MFAARAATRARRRAWLGLAICRAIVEAHDGTIIVQTRPGGGARFAIICRTRTDGATSLTATTSGNASERRCDQSARNRNARQVTPPGSQLEDGDDSLFSPR